MSELILKNKEEKQRRFARIQKTLASESSFSGVGLHTGKEVVLRFCPALAGEGITFKRVDLPGKPLVPALVEYVQDTTRSTNIGVDNVRIHTVEHVLAALKAYDIDNLCIEVSAPEPPIANGSSDVFVEMIKQAGVKELGSELPLARIEKPIYFSDGDIHMVAIPSDEYRVSYTLHYPETEGIGTQYFSSEITQDVFTRELAPCRTFAKYEEVSYLIDQGLIKGGSLDNAVIVKDDVVFSKEGLFFPDEMVRHKVLDLIGDLSLVGFPFLAHIISIRSGHCSNVAFAKKIYDEITKGGV